MVCLLISNSSFYIRDGKSTFVENNAKRYALSTYPFLCLAALQPEAETCVTSLKASMMLYENLIAFELFLGNVKSAVSRMRTLVSEKPSFVEGWVLLLSLYIHRSPMDAVVTVAEDAIHRCEHDVEIVYVYTNWLYKQVCSLSCV